MARFSFTAQDKERKIIHGILEAPNRADAIQAVLGKGLDPIKLALLEGKSSAFGEAAPSKWTSINISFRKGLTLFDQINVLRHLGTILNTGTDLLSGLDIIARDAINPVVKKMLYDIKERMGRGEKFSDAIEKWKDQFSPIFVNLVRSAEESGTLPKTLISYAQELRKDYTFLRRLRGALTYPAVLVVAVIVMVVILISFVTPRLKELFLSTKAEPPFYTKIFFTISDLWLSNMGIILFVLGALSVLLFFLLRNKRIRRKLMTIVWYLPVLNQINKNLALTRFCKTLANLIEGGFSIKSSLTITSEILGLNYEKALKTITKDKLEKGIPFSDALRDYEDLFPRILVSVVATGEKSGQLAPVLNQMAEFYEEEVIYTLELFMTLIEPALLVFVGLIVGLLAASIISPIYRLIGRF